MYLTEEEAKQKWCPHFRCGVIFGSGVAAVNVDADSQTINCIASDCMMWRWSLDNREYKGQAHGYCGLAGRPE